MKRTFVYLVLILLLFFGFTNNVHGLDLGAAKLTITGPTTANAGDTITLNIMLDIISYGNATSLSYYNGRMNFDASKIQYINYEYINGDHSAVGDTGNWYPGVFSFAPRAISTGSTGVKVRFKINDTIADGTTLNFATSSSITRMNSNVPNDEGKYYFDMPTTGSTLSIRVANPSNNTTSNPNNNTSQSKSNNTTESKSENNQIQSKSSNADLKSLSVDKYSFDKVFNPNTLEYNIKVASDTNEIDINYETEDAKSTVEIIGNKALKFGNNVIKIVVTAEDGTTKEYIINVEKTNDKTKAGNNNLKAPRTENKKSNSNLYLNIVIGSISLIGVSAVGYIIYIKKFKKNIKKSK